MFRAIILTVVLLFAAGPSASQLCLAWCDPHAAAESGCHHERNSGQNVTRHDSCEDSIQWLGGALKEDLRRAPASDGGAVVLTARFQIVPSASRLGAAWNLGRLPSDVNRPQTAPLRI